MKTRYAVERQDGQIRHFDTQEQAAQFGTPVVPFKIGERADPAKIHVLLLAMKALREHQLSAEVPHV